jgi:hypothetical protein
MSSKLEKAANSSAAHLEATKREQMVAARAPESKDDVVSRVPKAKNPLKFDVTVDLDDYEGASIGKARPHPHPVLHAGRQYWEEMIYRELKDLGCNVVDVGGTLKRHSIYQRALHSMQPTIYDYDVQKNINDRTLVTQQLTMCDHVLEYGQCSCCPQKPGFMMIDSVYYMHPKQIASLAILGPVIALHHRFNQPFAKYGKEGCYHAEGNDVVMTVVGNKNTYRHGNMRWMDVPYPTSYGWLVSDSKQVDKYRYVTHFNVVHEKPLFFAPADEYTITLDSRSPISSLIENAPNVARPVKFNIWGDYFIGDCGIMSSAAYHAVRSTVVGKTRDKLCLQLCVNAAKKVHAKLLDFPADLVDKSITLAAVLGFCANVELKHKLRKMRWLTPRICESDMKSFSTTIPRGGKGCVIE